MQDTCSCKFDSQGNSEFSERNVATALLDFPLPLAIRKKQIGKSPSEVPLLSQLVVW